MRGINIPFLVLLGCLTSVQAQDFSSVDRDDAQMSKIDGVRGARRILLAGGIDNSTVGGTHVALNSSEIYDEKTGTFVASGTMKEGRVGHAATLLKDGKVLITGGDGAETNHPVASAELFDPETGTFIPLGNMTVARVGHTSVLLSSGLVLIAGGQDENFVNLKTAELFDPSTGSFTPTGNMNDARTGHTATLLADGKVLITGGENPIAGVLGTAELYDPTTGTFDYTGSMSTPRQFATATLLADGKVLVAGGGSLVGNCLGCSVSSAEVYDPHSGAFMSVGAMQFARRGHIAIRLRSHDVLVAGGLDDSLADPQRFLSSAEIFDSRTLTFSPTSNMTIARFNHSASLLTGGDVLITGGFISGFVISNTAEVYDPRTRLFTVTGMMTDARADHTSTGLRGHDDDDHTSTGLRGHDDHTSLIQVNPK